MARVVPAEAVELAAAHLAQLDAAFPKLVEGLFLTGSVALGDFVPGVSDVDFIALTNRPVEPGDHASLASIHEGLRASTTTMYDGVYVERAALRRPPINSEVAPHVLEGRYRPSEQCFQLSPITWIELPTLSEQCADTARAVGVAVACPTLLPEFAQPTPVRAGPCPEFGRRFVHPGCGAARTVAIASIDWPTADRVGHLVIVSSPAPLSADEIVFFPLPPSASLPLVHVRTLEIGEIEAEVVQVPQTSESAFGGHEVLVWRKEEHTYALGVHGHDREARRLNVALVESLRYVEG